MLLLKEKYKNKIILESEKPLGNGIICDIYQEFSKEGKAIAYEIQKEDSPKWRREIVKKYENLKNIDLVIVPLKELPNDINELIKILKKIIV